MTKAELLAELTQNGVLTHSCNHALWTKVFKFYKDETGDKSMKQCCGSCHNKVLKWLRNG